MNSNDIIWIPGYNLDSNCYLIDDMLVDTGAGDNKEYLFSKLKEHGVNPEDIKLIVNTHCHFDHVNGNCFFPNAKIAIHKIDAIALMEEGNPDTVASHFGSKINCHKVDIELEEGDKIKDFEVIHTPGHSKGAICLWDGENLISGDTVFGQGGVGRTDIGGSWSDLKESVEKLKKLDVKTIYPGHGMIDNNGKKSIEMSYYHF